MDINETLQLDRPCHHCKALFLDDADQGGKVKRTEDGTRYVDFGTIRESKTARNGPLMRAIDTEADEPKVLPKIDLKLGYKRQDSLPHMPGFLETASHGCSFCAILRDDIIRAWSCKKENVEKYQNDSVEIHSAEISVTEICYKLDESLASHLKLEKSTEDNIGLTSLHVFFTISWGEKANDYTLAYDAYTNAEDPCAPWLQCRRTPVSNSMLSPVSVNRLGSLVAKTCEASQSARLGCKYLPTRLLEVDPSAESQVRLILTQQESKLKAGDHGINYIALSYCWGPKADQQLTTKSISLAENLQGICITKLPKTVADAVQLCKLLQIRYLWVDALCIIQDDDRDWARESSDMANIYANSYLTLCALRGSSCVDGFLESKHTPRTLKVDFSSTLDPEVTGQIYLRMLQPPEQTIAQGFEQFGPPRSKDAKVPADEDFQVAAWNTRGWTYQEAQLSPRKLYVGETMFHMSCGSVHESADGTGFYEHLDLVDSNASLDKHIQEWYHWARRYSERKLTYEKDRFPAFSAIARTLSERFPDQQYVAGLWKSDLHRGLLWTPSVWTTFDEHFKPPSHSYIAPSWSWARQSHSVDWVRGVNHECVFVPECQWEDINIILNSANLFGGIESAHIQVNTRILPLLPQGDERKIAGAENWESLFLGFVFHFVVKSSSDEYITHLHLDWLQCGCEGYPDGPLDEIYMVLISSSTFQLSYNSWKPTENREVTHPECMLGLLVLPTGNENEFMKLGLWCSESRGLGGRNLWEKAESRSVRLV